MDWETLKGVLNSSPILTEMIYSVLVILLVVLVRAFVLKWYFRHNQSWEIEQKRRWLVVTRNVALIAGIMGLLVVWAAQIQHIALSMVAIAAAIVLATKELLMCLLGSLLRSVTQQYSVGDYIEINGMRGRVVDINLLNTLMMQIGPTDMVGQLSGKTISFPNSLLLGHPVERDNILGNFVVHTLDIPVPIHLDADQIVPRLQTLLEHLCAPYIDSIEHKLEIVQVQKLFITPAARPRVNSVPGDDKVYRIVVRFASPVAKRLEIQQEVLNEFIRIQHQLLRVHPVLP